MTNFWLNIIPKCKVEVIFKEVRLLRNELRPFSWYDMHSPKCNFACKSKGISNKWSPSKLLWLKNLHFGFMTSRALVWGVRILENENYSLRISIIKSSELNHWAISSGFDGCQGKIRWVDSIQVLLAIK